MDNKTDWNTLTRAVSPIAFVSAILWGAATLFAQVQELDRRMARVEAKIEQVAAAELQIERRMNRLEARSTHADRSEQ